MQSQTVTGSTGVSKYLILYQGSGQDVEGNKLKELYTMVVVGRENVRSIPSSGVRAICSLFSVNNSALLWLDRVESRLKELSRSTDKLQNCKEGAGAFWQDICEFAHA